jgi:hypothetical protein
MLPGRSLPSLRMRLVNDSAGFCKREIVALSRPGEDL